VTRYPPAVPDEYELADLCKGAASTLRTRSGSAAASAGGQLDSALGEFLEAVGRAVTLDAASIPVDVKQSAFRVAEQVQTGRRRRSGIADTVPFTRSVRLGRMG
jgi:hypothetical protein